MLTSRNKKIGKTTYRVNYIIITNYSKNLFFILKNVLIQLNRIQLVLSSAARAVTKTPKFHHNTPILESLN